jgi:hypothetical protein
MKMVYQVDLAILLRMVVLYIIFLLG